MQIAGFEDVYLTKAQQRLLGGWRDILDDIRHLCRSLNALPESCTCGHGSSHLSGSCACCAATHANRIPACDDCERLLMDLRPEIDVLSVDTMRFFPIVAELVRHHAPENAQRAAVSIAHDVGLLVRTFDHLVMAVDEFRAGCRASHLHVVKECATELSRAIDALDRRLEGPPR